MACLVLLGQMGMGIDLGEGREMGKAHVLGVPL